MLFSKAKTPVVTLFALVMALVLAFGMVPAWATPAEDKQAEADAAFEELTEKQEILDKAANDYGEAAMAQEAAEAAVADAQKRIDEATARIAILQDHLSNRAKSMYRQGGFSILDVVLSSESLSDLLNNWDLLNVLNQKDADMIQETKDLKAEVEKQKVILVEQQKIATEKAAEAKRIMDEAQEVLDEVQAIYDSLSEEAAELLAAEQAAAAAASWGDTGSNSSYSSGNYNNDYSGRADAGSVVGRAWALYNEGDCYYSWGGVGELGFDCSGFVSYCLTGNYSRLGTTYTFLTWTEVSDPQPGDVCVNSGHCGIYIGGGQMIHAASPGEGIVVGSVQSGMIYVRY